MLRKGQKQLVNPAARQGKYERGGGGEKLNLSLSLFSKGLSQSVLTNAETPKS